MKIGVVTHYMPPHDGGIERVAEALVRGYRRHGLDVRWLASRAPEGASEQDGDLVRVKCWNPLERRLGVPVPIWAWDGWQKMRALVRWADVLHVHDCLYPGSVWGVALGAHHHKPVLLTQHVGLIGYQNVALRNIELAAYASVGRAVLARASSIVYATPAAAAFVPDLLGRTPPRASTIPNGIELGTFDPPTPARRAAARARLGLSANESIALFVGRLVEKKGLPLVLEVARRLADVRFLIIGDGPLARLLDGAGDNVIWKRAVGHPALADHYHAADCLLLPSRGEGLPLVVQEAMACGLAPIVSRDEAYARALAEAGVCTAVAPTADAIATAVEHDLRGPRPDRAARAREHAEAHWDISDTVKRYVALVRDLRCAAGS